MKLKDLKPILKSSIGRIQWTIVYDYTIHRDIEYGCSVEYAIKNYGDFGVEKIESCIENNQDYLLISVAKEN